MVPLAKTYPLSVLAAGVGQGHDLLAAADRGERIAAADRLAVHGQVRDHAVALLGAAPGDDGNR